MSDKLTRDDVLKLAKLSRLRLTDDEVKEFQQELSIILDFVSALDDVDVNQYPATDQVTGLLNVTRKDEVIEYGYNTDRLFDNVADRTEDYIKVPKMLSES